MVRDYLYGLVAMLAAFAIVVVVLVAAAWFVCFAGGATEHVASAEFVTTQAGAPRFQRYETNEDCLEVVVDAETGVAYLVTRDGVTQLVGQGGEPLTIAEVGE